MRLKTDYFKILKYSLIPVNLLLVLTFVLNYFKFLPAYWKSVYVFYFALVIDTCFFAFRIKKILEDKKDNYGIVYLSKYFFLLSLIILVFNQFLKRQIIIDNLSYLIGLSIALGFLTFFASKDRVEKGIEDKKTKDGWAEERRREEFDNKFKGISKLN